MHLLLHLPVHWQHELALPTAAHRHGDSLRDAIIHDGGWFMQLSCAGVAHALASTLIVLAMLLTPNPGYHYQYTLLAKTLEHMVVLCGHMMCVLLRSTGFS